MLLFGSSQLSVPGMKLPYSSLAYSSALMVSGLSIVTLLFLSTIAPPKAQINHCVQPESPVALPNARPPGVPLSFMALNSFRKPSVSFGKALKPAAFMWLSR